LVTRSVFDGIAPAPILTAGTTAMFPSAAWSPQVHGARATRRSTVEGTPPPYPSFPRLRKWRRRAERRVWPGTCHFLKCVPPRPVRAH